MPLVFKIQDPLYTIMSVHRQDGRFLRGTAIDGAVKRAWRGGHASTVYVIDTKTSPVYQHAA